MVMLAFPPVYWLLVCPLTVPLPERTAVVTSTDTMVDRSAAATRQQTSVRAENRARGLSGFGGWGDGVTGTAGTGEGWGAE